MTKTFCIKAGYVPRPCAQTIEASPGEYWTPTRIKTASYYQWDVYRLAGKIIKQHGLKTVLDVGAGYPAKLPLLGDVKEITLVDQSTLAPLVARDIPHVAFVPDDLENPTKLRERKFDLVICADVLEHLMDPDPCLQFIKNSTARFAVLSTPERDVVRGVDCMTSPKAEHVREWNADESRRYVESSGFDVIDQLLMPQGRLSQFKKSLASILGLKSKRWAGCQTIVCAPRK